ncbi:MAG: ArsB/NhaD family transporter [Candidatus Hadarchaeales archaeon]
MLAFLAFFLFILAIILTLTHPHVRIPFTKKRIHLDFGIATLICALILLIFSGERWMLLHRGMMGIDNLRPFSVIILILSLSFICLTLEYVGFFEYVALKFLKTARNGKKLFLNIFILTFLLTLPTDNDIVILTLTFTILHICRHAKINPIPFLFLQFFSTNIAGMALYIGNPTNIIVADFVGIDFVEFAKFMLLPSFLSTLVCTIALWIIFRKQIPESLEVQMEENLEIIRDRKAMWAGLLCLFLTITLIGLPKSITKLPAWSISLIFAILLAFFISYRKLLRKIAVRVPWKIAPYLIGLFVLVEGLAYTGWTARFSSIFSIFRMSSISIVAVCFAASWLSGFMNNHPMAVFFSRSLNVQNKGVALAIIAGSDIGPCTMITGSLAGIMWSEILTQSGYPISFSEFTKYGFIISLLAIFTTSAVISAEILLF